jgi:hypothetical protein
MTLLLLVRPRRPHVPLLLLLTDLCLRGVTRSSLRVGGHAEFRQYLIYYWFVFRPPFVVC